MIAGGRSARRLGADRQYQQDGDYNYDHFDRPVIVYETPRPQLTVSVLIQQVDEPALQDVFSQGAS